jgi:uroporphyrinogen-III synthase
MGHEVAIAPLMVTEAVAWQPPELAPEAVLITSAAAARLAGDAAAAWRDLPCYCVGSSSAKAARAAGFADVRVGPGSVQPLVDEIAGAGITRLLHLAGEDRTVFAVPAGLRIMTRSVYRARLLPLAVAAAVDVALLYSARAARHFAGECDRLGLARGRIGLVAMSAVVAAAAGPGWAHVATAQTPEEDALLAAIAEVCH